MQLDTSMRIGVDLMGSDCSPTILFHAIEQAAKEFPHVEFLVILNQAAWDEIHLHSKVTSPMQRGNVKFQIARDVIEMHDEPLLAIRQKKNSSLALGIKLLKKRALNGLVSAGNTGALIAGAALSLPLLPTIKRPALLATLPTQKGEVAIIDVGGNLSCKAHHLAQFAQLGVAYQRCLGIMQPRVGLLNIGVESKKGTSELRQAYSLLQQLSQQGEMLFVGNIEARDVFRGEVDVLVTDGFTGNVLLKTSEGVSSFIINQLRQVLQDLIPEKGSAILRSMQNHFDYEEYNGAIICGIDCVVVKCHGQSSPKGLLKGIEGAVHLVEHRFTELIKTRLEDKASIQ